MTEQPHPRSRTRRPRAVRATAFALVLPVLAAVLGGCGGDEAERDPKRGQQWALDALRLPDAWQKSKGEDTVVAVVDTGVDLDHPDLKDKLVDGYDFVDGDRKPRDENGHGTHVAGIAAAATDNGVGIAGGAPGAGIMPVRVLGHDGGGRNADITKGIVWAADHGADVINLSLGEGPLMSRLLHGGILNAAIRHAYAKGAVVVAAAGNDHAATQPYKPGTPALVVNASNQNGRAANFSNFGSAGAVSAPGVDILSTLPTYTTPETATNDSGYGELDGTSMAAPYVSAVAALLHHEGADPAKIISTLRATARNPEKDVRLGRGVVNAQAAVDKAGG
ncbi:S8 family serine peptidase [Streptomyces sp. ODS28]|uniref:S8 family serine peptidase n=1 Tax=Streptomyces sp. ODS28 TaxID=3136688 RepID=UPI0031EABEE7